MKPNDSALATVAPTAVHGDTRGRAVVGFAQTLGIWLAAVAVVVMLPYLAADRPPQSWTTSPAAGWLCLAAGLSSGLWLGHWHRRRGRVDTAVGAFAGLVAWPVVIGVVIATIAVVAAGSAPE